jgi:hypothetical protein
MSDPDELSDEVLLQSVKGWLSRPNVVGLSIGAKVVAGVAAERRAIIVHVARKVPLSALGAEGFVVPTEVEFQVHHPDGSLGVSSVPTDVIEVGEAQLQVLDQRVRPCPGGYQVKSHGIALSGTLGVNMVWRGRYRLLASNHVISENGHVGDDVYQPRQNPNDIVGNVTGYIPVVTYPSDTEPQPVFNHQDLAWSDVGQEVCAATIHQIGVPKGRRAPQKGESVRLIGKQTGTVQTARIASVGLGMKLRWPVGGNRWAWFEELIQLDSVVTQSGDSGAAYVADDDMVVGLHIGANGAYSFGCVIPV